MTLEEHDNGCVSFLTELSLNYYDVTGSSSPVMWRLFFITR